MRYFYFLGSLILSIASYAQSVSIEPKLSPQSPNVASLGRFGEHPVSLYTGIPSISVPIHSIEAGDIRVPVSLEYHAGGHRVTDVASWAGLGWSLNAGGVITRTVVGRPDERDGILNHPLNTALPNPGNYPNTIDQCDVLTYELEQYTKGVYDTGYDIFSFNLPGKSGKFILVPDGSASMVTTMPYEKLKISYVRNGGGSINEFTVVDEGGVTYTFNQVETVNNNDQKGAYDSAWLLSSIRGNRPADEIRFYYDAPAGYNGTTDFWDSITIVDQISGNCVDALGSQSSTKRQISTTFSSLLLREIVFPGGKIVCDRGATRTDIEGNNQVLDRVDVFGLNVNSNTYQRLKRFDLQQSYFSIDNPQNFYYRSGSLRLDAVAQQDADGNTVSSYRFDYNTDVKLPGPASSNRDTWGYFNGKNNTTLIPTQTITLRNTSGDVGSVTVGSADRSVSEYHMQAFILNKVTYPTGGYSRFAYEANRYFENGTKLAGGLRVTSIETQASPSEAVKIKTYKYGQGQSGNGILNGNLKESFWRSGYSERTAPYCDRHVTILGSNYNGSLIPFDGSPVTYSEVTEYEGTNADYNQNGKTIFTFQTGGDMMWGAGVGDDPSKSYVASYHWERGQLLSKTVYNQGGSPVSKLVNNYTNLVKTEVSNIGVLIPIPRYVTQSWMDYGDNRTNLPYPCDLLRFTYGTSSIQYYPWPKGNLRLASTQNWTYGLDGSAVLTSSQTDYNGDFQPSESRVYASDGTVTVKKIRYPNDISLPGNQNTFARGIQVLRDRHMLNTVVEDYSVKKANANESNPVLTSGKITFFHEPPGIGGYSLPKEVHQLQVADRNSRLSNYSQLNLSSGNVDKSPQYSLELTFDEYDGLANPVQFSLRNGLKTRLNWLTKYTDSNGTTSRFSVIQAETANYATAHSQTTQYSYEVPLEGIRTITDPNGQSTRFEYDRATRLDIIRDNNYNLVKSFDYNYAQGERNTKSLPGVTITPPTNPPTNPPTSCRVAENPGNLVNGLTYQYYESIAEGDWCTASGLANQPVVKQGVTSDFSTTPRLRDFNFGFSYAGYINVPSDGQYTFYLSSDDESRLLIGGQLVTIHAGCHGLANPGQEPSGTICLKAGYHPIQVLLSQGGGGFGVQVYWQGPTTGKQLIPSNVLFTANSNVINQPPPPTGTGSIGRKYWLNTGGGNLGTFSSQTNNYQTTPSGSDVLTSLRAKDWSSPTTVNWGDSYGQFIQGYLVAPQTGQYVFWLAADDQAELWLSTTDNPTNKQRISWMNGWSGPDEWTREPNQKSATLTLTAGQRYYLEVIHTEGGGGDNLSVGWAKPGQSQSQPSEIVPGSALQPYGSGGCTAPSLSLGTASCNGTTYSLPFTTQSGAVVTASAGTVQGSQIAGIPVGSAVTLTATLNGCSAQLSASSPNCGGGSSGLVTGKCYSIQNQQSLNFAQRQGDNYVKMVTRNTADNTQLWKADAVGSQFRFISQGGSGIDQVLYIDNTNCGSELKVGGYTNDANHNWTVESYLSGAYRVQTQGKTWDQRSAGNDPILQMCGDNNAGDGGYNQPYRLFVFSEATCPGASCSAPSLSLGTPTCNGTSTYTVPFTAQAGATVTVSAGSVQGSQVINVPVGTNVTLTATLNGCSAQLAANSPTCGTGGSVVDCFIIRNQSSGQYVQAMTDNTVQHVNTASGQLNQVWKFEVADGGLRISSASAANRVVYVDAYSNDQQVRLGSDQLNIDRYRWIKEAVSGTSNFRVRSGVMPWLQQFAGTQPLLQIWGDINVSPQVNNPSYSQFIFQTTGCP